MGCYILLTVLVDDLFKIFIYFLFIYNIIISNPLYIQIASVDRPMQSSVAIIEAANFTPK
jgi:hypothetical protein